MTNNGKRKCSRDGRRSSPAGGVAPFANGFMVAQPMELHFVVCWSVSALQPTDSGSPAQILPLMPLELSFEDEGYKVACHLDGIDGTLTRPPNLGASSSAIATCGRW
jgi:hypothetical protein